MDVLRAPGFAPLIFDQTDKMLFRPCSSIRDTGMLDVDKCRALGVNFGLRRVRCLLETVVMCYVGQVCLSAAEPRARVFAPIVAVSGAVRAKT